MTQLAMKQHRRSKLVVILPNTTYYSLGQRKTRCPSIKPANIKTKAKVNTTMKPRKSSHQQVEQICFVSDKVFSRRQWRGVMMKQDLLQFSLHSAVL